MRGLANEPNRIHEECVVSPAQPSVALAINEPDSHLRRFAAPGLVRLAVPNFGSWREFFARPEGVRKPLQYRGLRYLVGERGEPWFRNQDQQIAEGFVGFVCDRPLDVEKQTASIDRCRA